MNDEIKKDEPAGGRRIQVNIPPDLDYVYRDIFNVYIGPGDVVIEFGNLHRAVPDHATISNRIVVSVHNAYLLVQTLQQALQQAAMNTQQNLQKMQERKE